MLLRSSSLWLTLILVATVAWLFAPAGVADSASGKTVYEASCKSCHSGGFSGWMSGAPKTGDKEDWVPLLKKGLPALIESSLNGFGKMSPRGGCTTCTDEEIAAAVEYMVSASR